MQLSSALVAILTIAPLTIATPTLVSGLDLEPAAPAPSWQSLVPIAKTKRHITTEIKAASETTRSATEPTIQEPVIARSVGSKVQRRGMGKLAGRGGSSYLRRWIQ